MQRKAIAMWMDPWLLDASGFERMADAHRESATHHLLRMAQPGQPSRSNQALFRGVTVAACVHWVKDRIQRIVRIGRPPGARRGAWDTKRTQHGVP